MRATTDSNPAVDFETMGPGVANLLSIYQAFSGDADEAIKAQFDRLYMEGADNGQVMCLPLHPYLIGVPVIGSGTSMPSSARTVGATSESVT